MIDPIYHNIFLFYHLKFFIFLLSLIEIGRGQNDDDLKIYQKQD
jgi:hypothetical protein